MKATVTEVQTLNLQLNRDEAIVLARAIQVYTKGYSGMLMSNDLKLLVSIKENITQGMQVSV